MLSDDGKRYHSGKGRKKVYQAQKALIKENAAWDFIDMYEKTEGKENLYNTDKVHFLQMQDICT